MINATEHITQNAKHTTQTQDVDVDTNARHVQYERKLPATYSIGVIVVVVVAIVASCTLGLVMREPSTISRAQHTTETKHPEGPYAVNSLARVCSVG